MAAPKIPPADVERLIDAALTVRQSAYAPYSRFYVGAAVKTASGIYAGCNVENVSFGLCLCAERTAIAGAVCAGARDIGVIAICGGIAGQGTSGINAPESIIAPCGMCRQVIYEFNKECIVILAKSKTEYEVTNISTLLPCGFDAALQK